MIRMAHLYDEARPGFTLCNQTTRLRSCSKGWTYVVWDRRCPVCLRVDELRQQCKRGEDG